MTTASAWHTGSGRAFRLASLCVRWGLLLVGFCGPAQGQGQDCQSDSDGCCTSSDRQLTGLRVLARDADRPSGPIGVTAVEAGETLCLVGEERPLPDGTSVLDEPRALQSVPRALEPVEVSLEPRFSRTALVVDNGRSAPVRVAVGTPIGDGSTYFLLGSLQVAARTRREVVWNGTVDRVYIVAIGVERSPSPHAVAPAPPRGMQPEDVRAMTAVGWRLHRRRLDSLDTELTRRGFPSTRDHHALLDVRLEVALHRIRLGASSSFGPPQRLRGTGADKTSVDEILSSAYLGIDLLRRHLLVVSPVVGIGIGRIGVTLSGNDPALFPLEVEEIGGDPFASHKVGFIEGSLGIDNVLLEQRTATGGTGLWYGARLGYMKELVDGSWRLGHGRGPPRVQGGPALDLSGPFLAVYAGVAFGSHPSPADPKAK